MAEHNIYQNGGGRDFAFFNDDPNLSMEPITADDLRPVRVSSQLLASFAWSSNVRFYFILLDEGLLLVHAPSGDGVLCKKKSGKFIEAFIEAPYPEKTKRSH